MSIIREIRESDAENFLALCKQLDNENKFMLLQPGERKITPEEQRQWNKEILWKDNQTIFVAEESGKLGKRYSVHRLELSVMIHSQRGIGFYQKMGFEIEGIKQDSLPVDGSYVDEYYMAKLI